MSELRTTTLSNLAGTGPANLHMQSASKQWCRWNMSGTPAIVDSFNTSSLTDNGTGRGQLAYTTNMDDGDYQMSACAGELTGGGNRNIGVRGGDKTPAVDGCAYYTFSGTSTAEDVNLASASIHGDLA